jgi:hypothetical protein
MACQKDQSRITGDSQRRSLRAVANQGLACAVQRGRCYIRTKSAAPETSITIFFSATPLVVLDALPKGAKLDQEHFLNWVLPKLHEEKQYCPHHKGPCVFWVRMDNSMDHNGRKIVAEFGAKHRSQMPHQAYSPVLWRLHQVPTSKLPR